MHLIGIPLDGTSVKPARSLGPAIIVAGTALSQVWLHHCATARRGDCGAALPLHRSHRTRRRPSAIADGEIQRTTATHDAELTVHLSTRHDAEATDGPLVGDEIAVFAAAVIVAPALAETG